MNLPAASLGNIYPIICLWRTLAPESLACWSQIAAHALAHPLLPASEMVPNLRIGAHPTQLGAVAPWYRGVCTLHWRILLLYKVDSIIMLHY